VLPPLHQSHDHLNKQIEVEVDNKVEETWRLAFQKLTADNAEEGVDLVWFIVDGFVLYWDKVGYSTFQSLISGLCWSSGCSTVSPRTTWFAQEAAGRTTGLRSSKWVETAATLILADPDDAAAGGVWVDPPHYFDQIVYPAYVKAHEDIFEGGDVEKGELRKGWDLKVMAPLEGKEEMTRAFEQSCENIIEACRRGAGTVIDPS